MASPHQYFSFRKLLLLYLVSFLFSSILICAFSETGPQNKRFLGRRQMLEMEEEDDQPKKKPKPSLSTKNQNKLVKPKSATNSTKKAAETSTETITLTKINRKKLNSTSSSSNATKPNSASLKKYSDLLKSANPKNKTAQLIVTKKSQSLTEKKSSEAKSKSQDKLQSSESKSKTPGKKQSSTTDSKSKSFSSSSSKEQSSESKSRSPEKKQQTEEKNQQQKKSQKPTKPYWMDQEDDDDLVLEFRDLPSKFHQALIPDLKRISTNSRAYITKGFKPLVGNKYAPTIASILSCVFIIVPLLLVSLIFNRIKAYFSLQKILIFIQVYLSIYFSILSLSSLLTGLEPLKFFYATSQSSYVWLQVLQTLGYVLYLLLLLMYLVVVFATENGLGSKLLGLGQTMVGVAVGLHYYATVFHKAVLHQPPKTNWKVHGIYAVCFLVICLFAGAERRKKAYLHDGGEEGKKS